jgi:hypothetical protein
MHDPNLQDASGILDTSDEGEHNSVHEELVWYLPSHLDIITDLLQRGVGAEGGRPGGSESRALLGDDLGLGCSHHRRGHHHWGAGWGSRGGGRRAGWPRPGRPLGGRPICNVQVDASTRWQEVSEQRCAAFEVPGVRVMSHVEQFASCGFPRRW